MFTGQLEEMVDKSKGIEYYLDTNEEEDKKYWISRMAKQEAACDMISFGHVGTGNMDSIIIYLSTIRFKYCQVQYIILL